MNYTPEQLDELRNAIVEMAIYEKSNKELSAEQLRVIFYTLTCNLPVEYVKPYYGSDHLSSTVNGWFVRDC